MNDRGQNGTGSDGLNINGDSPSIASLYLMLGQLLGKVDALTASMNQKDLIITETIRKLAEIEKKVAVGVFVAGVLGVVSPVAITVLFTTMTPSLEKEEVQELRRELSDLHDLRRATGNRDQSFIHPARKEQLQGLP